MSYQRTRIQLALMNAANAGTFYPVSYDVNTKLPSVDDAASVQPQTVLANELTASFGEPVRNRRAEYRERGDWTFELRLEFNQEVVLERFEESLESEPIKLARDDLTGLRQVTLELEDADYSHPTMQGSAKGTRVAYRFNARVSPK